MAWYFAWVKYACGALVPCQWNVFSVKKFQLLTLQNKLPNAGWREHLRGNHFEQILPLDAYYTLGTQNWKCSGGTTSWAISCCSLQMLRPRLLKTVVGCALFGMYVTSTTACGDVGSFKSRAYNPEEDVLVETFVTTASHLLVSSHLLTPFFRWLYQRWYLHALLQHALACDNKLMLTPGLYRGVAGWSPQRHGALRTHQILHSMSLKVLWCATHVWVHKTNRALFRTRKYESALQRMIPYCRAKL